MQIYAVLIRPKASGEQSRLKKFFSLHCDFEAQSLRDFEVFKTVHYSM